MPGTSPVILILGAGPNIGQAVARTFASRGYKVALAARSLDEADSTDNQLNITSDFANSDDVVNAFKRVNKVFGIPSVVVYNVSASTLTPPQDPFALPLAAFNRDVTINITSAFVAAQQAAFGFAQLPASASRTFIYTGNILNVAILPSFLDQGVGKSAGAHMIWAASAAYKDRGFKFYYGDERRADGTAKYRVDGEAHAELYWKLAEEKTHGPWMQTFVKGVGYTKFDSQYASSS
ncbi:NAD(P)-binding protein [Rhizodiscina lignyota]|uniref:NAD(P)-binding protein n=1 Tax=Rhizodiscina lignyota TaxID=1504668 RepID=A0A9P4IBW0_9PEZI|nr:NAD(P)-binding protein [Rhizodiscina lignyota]